MPYLNLTRLKRATPIRSYQSTEQRDGRLPHPLPQQRPRLLRRRRRRRIGTTEADRISRQKL